MGLDSRKDLTHSENFGCFLPLFVLNLISFYPSTPKGKQTALQQQILDQRKQIADVHSFSKRVNHDLHSCMDSLKKSADFSTTFAALWKKYQKYFEQKGEGGVGLVLERL